MSQICLAEEKLSAVGEERGEAQGAQIAFEGTVGRLEEGHA